MAVVLGLVAGVFAILLFWFATASIYSSSPAVTIFWEKHDNIFAVYDRSLRNLVFCALGDQTVGGSSELRFSIYLGISRRTSSAFYFGPHMVDDRLFGAARGRVRFRLIAGGAGHKYASLEGKG
jgi:hypothetical protein